MLRLAMIDKMQITPIDFKSPRNKLKGTQSSDDIGSEFPLISTKYNEYMYLHFMFLFLSVT